VYSVEEDGVSLERGVDVSTGQEEAVASVFVERPVVVGVRELLGWVIQVGSKVSAAEDVKEIDSVCVVATSELEALFEGTGVSEAVTDSLPDVSDANDDVSEVTAGVLLLEINVSVTEGTSGVLNELLNTSEAVEDAVSLERVSVDGVEVAKDEDSEAVGVDKVSNELNEIVHDSTGVDEADSVSEALVSEALVSVALERTLLLSENVAVNEFVDASTLDTLLADKVSSEELDVSGTEEVSETVPVMVTEDSSSEDVAVAELKEKVIQEIVGMTNVEEKTVSVVATLLMVELAGGL